VNTARRLDQQDDSVSTATARRNDQPHDPSNAVTDLHGAQQDELLSAFTARRTDQRGDPAYTVTARRTDQQGDPANLAAAQRAEPRNEPVKAAAARRPASPKHNVKLHWPLFWTAAVAVVIYWGMHAHLERYINPKRGLGYCLGIVGGSMMALLLIYSARKRFHWLRWMGGIPAWFEIHMVLGVVGPILILFHANFHLGASNSNVALICMLLVAGSGVVGRYIYTRLHAHMDGHQDNLDQLKQVGEKLRQQAASVQFLPGVMDAIESVEKRFIEPPPGQMARVLHLFTGAARSFIARWLVHREIRRAVRNAITARSSTPSAVLLARHAIQLGTAARRYADRRLEAGRRTAEYRAYARLFSFWHVLHIPIFFMLLISAIVHIIAVNVY
jgi:hypothetical protein